jgi:hypothetical protein
MRHSTRLAKLEKLARQRADRREMESYNFTDLSDTELSARISEAIGDATINGDPYSIWLKVVTSGGGRF